MGEAESAFDRALTGEILASERIRVRVLTITLAVLVVIDQTGFVLFFDHLAPFMTRTPPWWIPLALAGPFLVYESLVLLVLHRIRRPPRLARFLNAAVETTLPSVILWAMSHYANPEIAFGTWPSLLYFIFIVASTLRLDFVLPAFTGLASAVGYMAVVAMAVDLSREATDPVLSPIYHVTKAGIMVAAGVVAGFVAI